MKPVGHQPPPWIGVAGGLVTGGRWGIGRHFWRPRKPAENGVGHGRRHRAERQRAGRITVLPGPTAFFISRLIPQLPAKVVWVVHLVLQNKPVPSQGLP